MFRKVPLQPVIVALGCLLVTAVLLMACGGTRSFNAQEWRTNVTQRQVMIDDLLQNHTPIGASRNDVLNLLGTPSDTERVEYQPLELWHYFAGQISSGEQVFLTLRVQGDRVVDARKWIP